MWLKPAANPVARRNAVRTRLSVFLKGSGLSSTDVSNEAIKKIFTLCEITRMVSVRNPKTGEEEKRQINEIASSHMAQRTFIGNLYKKVKDPSLVGALSGHKEGSKAFARYREIDEDMKKNLSVC